MKKIALVISTTFSLAAMEQPIDPKLSPKKRKRDCNEIAEPTPQGRDRLSIALALLLLEQTAEQCQVQQPPKKAKAPELCDVINT